MVKSTSGCSTWQHGISDLIFVQAAAGFIILTVLFLSLCRLWKNVKNPCWNQTMFKPRSSDQILCFKKTLLSFLLLDKYGTSCSFKARILISQSAPRISARDVTRNNQPSWGWKHLEVTRGAPKPGLVLVPSGWTLLELQWQSCHVLRWPPSQLQPPGTFGANGYAVFFFSEGRSTKIQGFVYESKVAKVVPEFCWLHLILQNLWSVVMLGLC